MIYRLPKYLYVVVCADGTACNCPSGAGWSWEHLPVQPYTSQKEGRAIVRDLDGVANDDAASLDSPFRAPCGPHRIVRYAKAVLAVAKEKREREQFERLQAKFATRSPR